MSTDSDEDTNAQKVIKNIHEIYVEGKESLCSIAQDIGLSVFSPRRKVSTMIIGNHSAGKSSFINWYVEDNIQRTGVAIETQGFTFVTSGTKRTSAPIKGESTIMLFPYLKQMKQRFGKPLVENLTTSVTTSKAKSFHLVDFIDTPGLVDGDISYPFDVNDAIVSMAEYADLIFVFLDPMGQALCSRTMKVVKALNKEHYDKMRYYLTKADTVQDPKELMKLMVQITQNIKENINNQHGLEIPTIWLPSSPGAADPKLNQIDGLCDVIDTAIHQKVQDNLTQLETDCNAIMKKIDSLLQFDLVQRSAQRSRRIVASSFLLLSWMISAYTFLFLITSFQNYLPSSVSRATYVRESIAALGGLIDTSGETPGALHTIKLIGLSILSFIVLNGIAKFIHARAKKFDTKDDKTLIRWQSSRDHAAAVLRQREELFSDYVHTYTTQDS